MKAAPQYIVQAQVVLKSPHGARGSFGLPSFILDAGICGILDAAHAERIARRMLTDVAAPETEIHLSVALFAPADGGAK